MNKPPKKSNLVYGVGINDSNFIVYSRSVSGGQNVCPYYRRWKDMLGRCYSKKFQKRNSSYIGVSVCKEWHKFTTFKSWMESKDWHGMHLDKDLKVHGSKVYSPETCTFIPPYLNKILPKNSRGENKGAGVYFDKLAGKYRATCRVDGKNKHLGCFDDKHNAEETYREFKLKLMAKYINEFPELKDGIYNSFHCDMSQTKR